VLDVAAGRGATTYLLKINNGVDALGSNGAYEFGIGTNASYYAGTVSLPYKAMAIGAGAQNGMAIVYQLADGADGGDIVPNKAVTGIPYGWGLKRICTHKC